MSESNIIFLGGIHGVGKTTFAKQVLKEKHIPAFSASDLIYKTSSEEQKKKDTSTPDENQERLLRGLEKVSSSNDTFILDGHYTIFSNGIITPISTCYFHQMNLAKLILLIDKPEAIHKRRTSRDQYNISLESVRDHQEKELQHFKKIAKALKIPHTIVDLSSPCTSLTANLF